MTRPAAGPLLRSTVAGLASRSAGVFAQGVLGLASLALLSRLLRPEDFGLIGMTSVVLTFAGIFSQMGVAPALIQRPTLRPEHVRVAYTLSLAIGTAVAVLAWLSAPFVAQFFREPRVVPLLRVLSVNFVIAGQGVVSHALLERRLAYGRITQVDLAGQVAGGLLTSVVLAALGFGVWSLVAGQVLAYVVRGALLWRFEPHSRRPLVARREARELLGMGGGFTLSRIFHYGAMQGDYLIVGRILGADALGLYTRAYRLMMLPVTYFASVLSRVLFPTMARLQERRGRLRDTYLGASAVVAVVAAPLSVLLLIVAPELVRVLLGPGWDAVVDPFRILAAGIVFRASYPVGDALARGLGLMYRRSARDALYAALVIAGSLAGLRFGLPGVAGGVLCAVAVNYVTALRMSLPEVGAGWRDYLRAQAPGLLLAAVVAAVALPTRLALEGRVPPLPLLGLTCLAAATAAAAVLAARPNLVGEHGQASLRALLAAMEGSGLPPGVTRRLARLSGEPQQP